MNNVTLVGDSCSPISLISGDTNGDALLDVTETWVYGCTKTLNETTTNTVVATGYANGLTAVDVASATVVVGLPIVPPLIHITKVPSPLTLSSGAGLVTYTKKVTNPGEVALSNVTVTDDQCSPINFISGDTNGDGMLDTTETWTYTCSTNLTATRTNTAIATGMANGLVATDFALATVVVGAPVPILPKTGFGSEQNFLPIIIALVGIFSLSVFSFAVRSNKQAK
jgi:LPXTG-motif cell wall-anchored protein